MHTKIKLTILKNYEFLFWFNKFSKILMLLPALDNVQIYDKNNDIINKIIRYIIIYINIENIPLVIFLFFMYLLIE